MSRGN
jgi:DNA-binding NarL/FixJ family response regulator